jgi:hypothetical protein
MDLNSSFRGTAQLSVGLRQRLEQRIYPLRTRLLNQPLSDARRAHELLERSAAAGQIVLVP